MRKQTESATQIGCVLWFRMTYRPIADLLISIPNGSRLAGTQGQRAAQWARLKREGAKSGAPDLVLFVPSIHHHGLMVEMKTKTGRQTENQSSFQESATAQGYAYCVCRSLEDFQRVVRNYLLGTPYDSALQKKSEPCYTSHPSCSP